MVPRAWLAVATLLALIAVASGDTLHQQGQRHTLAGLDRKHEAQQHCLLKFVQRCSMSAWTPHTRTVMKLLSSN
jgi:hypothetical protein